MRVRLLTSTAKIHETLDIIWQVSKTDDRIDYAEPRFPDDLLQSLIDEGVPVLRHFYFTFMIEDMPIAFREQLVRSQYDHYWIQSGRITDWTKAEIEERDYENGHLVYMQDLAKEAIFRFIDCAEKNGIPPEDYRHMVPLGAMHRGIWTANLESLITRFKKRTCWVAQYGYWMEVLVQAKAEIENALDVRIPIRPPCRDKDWKHTGCTVAGVMEDRAVGNDPLPCCPLFLRHEGSRIDFGEDDDLMPHKSTKLLNDVLATKGNVIQDFETIWGRDAITRG